MIFMVANSSAFMKAEPGVTIAWGVGVCVVLSGPASPKTRYGRLVKLQKLRKCILLPPF